MNVFETVKQSVATRQAALLQAWAFSVDVLPEHRLKFCGGNKTKKSIPPFTESPCPAILKAGKMEVQLMAGRRICAGYYRRYDGKVVYVISTATDNDTREETVIWTTYPFADVPKYCTSTKKSFCAFVEADGERKAKYKRLMNMKISAEAVERLDDEGFRGPVRKRHRRQLEEAYDSREYQQSLTYLAYAKDLCENYNFDRSKYRLCVKEKRFAAITRSDFAKLKEDL